MTAVSVARRREGWAPAMLVLLGLVLLGLVPVAAGIARLVELASGAPMTEANARFLAAPLPVTLHVLAAIPYSLVGAWQFAPALRRRWPRWHQGAGRLLVVLGLQVALTGLWMTCFYPWPPGDGPALQWLRLVFGGAMVMAIVLALAAVRRRDFADHGAWMTRAYAIGMGAGTQVLTHVPYLMLAGKPDEAARAVLMGAGWVINLALAEWIIRAKGSRP